MTACFHQGSLPLVAAAAGRDLAEGAGAGWAQMAAAGSAKLRASATADTMERVIRVVKQARSERCTRVKTCLQIRNTIAFSMHYALHCYDNWGADPSLGGCRVKDGTL